MSVSKYMHIMAKNMDHVQLYEKRVMNKPKLYNIFKAFNPFAFLGTVGRNDTIDLDKNEKYGERHLINKFHKRFPTLKIMPTVYTQYRLKGKETVVRGSPIHDYIQKYKALRKKGYNEYKAFNIVEKELSVLIDSQLDETRILRGAAMAAHGDSYLDRSQRVAELESEMKLMRFMRDMPKHERNA